MKRNYFSLFFCLACFFTGTLTAQPRWSINPDGSISWEVKGRVPHYDHIEMSGLKVSTVLRYGVNADGSFELNKSMIWPMLRTIPNNTHASLMRRFAWNASDMVSVNGQSLSGEKVSKITLDGKMTVESTVELPRNAKAELTRIIFPAVSSPAVYEKYILRNTGTSPLTVEIPESHAVSHTDPAKGVDGSYKLVSEIIGAATKQLQPKEELVFYAALTGYKEGEAELKPDVEKELQARKDLITGFWNNLILETPDPVVNTMFAFAKIRGAESIYDTKGGLMHGPGGESYYAAIWANDQAEYINPFFPFLGYKVGNSSALNSFKHFARFMNPEYEKIPSSIVAEGLDVWGGAGDRGDAAMVAYGATRYALARGDKAEAEELWPLIEWCLEYCHRKLTPAGVVASNSDELENRFPAGDANLCTSSLYYDALRSAALLGRELGISSAQIKTYTRQADDLKQAIESHFGYEIEGFPSYRYYEGNDILRSWICMPLTVGIYTRAKGTIDALFSPRLWTDDGLLTQAGTETFWDRSTLYALRGTIAAGEVGRGMAFLKKYSQRRLLGDHVPYAIEAWPEGNQRHLSAESGLYCRIYTEGLFGIRPTGLRSFEITPRLPQEWEFANLNRVRAFGADFDIQVKRAGGSKLAVTIVNGKKTIKKTISEGQTITVRL